MNAAADMKPPLFPGLYSLFHFFTFSLVLFCPLSTVHCSLPTVHCSLPHCSLSFVIQITVSNNSPIFSVQSHETNQLHRFLISQFGAQLQ